MSNDLNHCSFIGRLGKDPETRFTADGAAVANFSIAVGSSWKDKASGEKKESTEWVRISAFGKLAEIIEQYCKKGKQVFVAGRLRTRKWQDKEGNDRYTTEVIAEQMQLLGGRDDRADDQESPASTPRGQAPKVDSGSVGDMDSDIPF